MRVDGKGGGEGCKGVAGDDGWIVVLGFGGWFGGGGGGGGLPRWEDERVEDGESVVEY